MTERVQQGRYQITSSGSGGHTVLLDTETGRSWKLDHGFGGKPNKWEPIIFGGDADPAPDLKK